MGASFLFNFIQSLLFVIIGTSIRNTLCENYNSLPITIFEIKPADRQMDSRTNSGSLEFRWLHFGHGTLNTI